MFASILTILLCASARPSGNETDFHPADFTENNIVGGYEVTPNFKYPWIATMHNFGQHFCGGTLINPTTLVTAAHCSIGLWFSWLTVTVHRHNLRVNYKQEGAVNFRVKRIIVHPDYDQKTQANDVAIWKLQVGLATSCFLM
jgi:secreted trypsin-like serine protease